MAEEGYVEALCRLNKVLHKLKDCSAELSEIESAVAELKPDANGDEMEEMEDRPDLLVIAGILRETMDSLNVGLERVRVVQRMQVPVLRLNSLEEDNNMRSRPSPVLGCSNPAENKGSDSGKVIEVDTVSASHTKIISAQTSLAKRVATARKGPQVCRHICIHHPEMIDPGLWSKLSEDLVGLIFARLPVPRIIELQNSSIAWSSLSDSSSFKRSFAEANPNLFGLLGWDNNLETFSTRMFDAKSKVWHGLKLGTFHLVNGYMDSWYACDGGLVCFVPEIEDEEDAEPCPVCVFNPLTNVWKTLPDLPLSKKEPVLLQLVADVEANSYRVLLVCREKGNLRALGVDVYDSQTGSWATMDSGLVYGSGNTLLGDRMDPSVFDCATKSLCWIGPQDPVGLRYSLLKDRVFVLHPPEEPSTQVHTSEMFMISEYEWQSSTAESKKVNEYAGALSGLPIGSYVGRKEMELFTSTGFILSTWDNLDDNGSVSQLIRLYDMAAKEWHSLPPLVANPATRNERLEGVFMCELRWDAVP